MARQGNAYFLAPFLAPPSPFPLHAIGNSGAQGALPHRRTVRLYDLAAWAHGGNRGAVVDSGTGSTVYTHRQTRGRVGIDEVVHLPQPTAGTTSGRRAW